MDPEEAILRLRSAVERVIAQFEMDAAYYAEGTCWGWRYSLARTREAIAVLRDALKEAT